MSCEGNCQCKKDAAVDAAQEVQAAPAVMNTSQANEKECVCDGGVCKCEGEEVMEDEKGCCKDHGSDE